MNNLLQVHYPYYSLPAAAQRLGIFIQAHTAPYKPCSSVRVLHVCALAPRDVAFQAVDFIGGAMHGDAKRAGKGIEEMAKDAHAGACEICTAHRSEQTSPVTSVGSAALLRQPAARLPVHLQPRTPLPPGHPSEAPRRKPSDGERRSD